EWDIKAITREKYVVRNNRTQRAVRQKKRAQPDLLRPLNYLRTKITSDCDRCFCCRDLRHRDYRDLPSVWLHSQLAYVLRIVFHSTRRWLFVPRFRNPSQRSQNRATDR